MEMNRTASIILEKGNIWIWSFADLLLITINRHYYHEYLETISSILNYVDVLGNYVLPKPHLSDAIGGRL